MKKILFSILLMGGLLSSCDMDLKPVGSIDDGESIENATDAYRFRTGMYNSIRALSTGGYISYTEMQMDGFIGTTMNGNRLGNINNGVILSGDTDFESIWSGLYGAIANCNYFLPRAAELLADDEIAAADAAAINHYVGETYFMRAFYYYWLLDHFCPAYSADNAQKNVGLPLVNEYNPTPVKGNYPGRSTLDETYKFINDDLDKAYTMLKEFEDNNPDETADMIAPNAAYISTYAVRALQSRMALLQGKNADAIKYAQEVISSGVFTLSNRTNYERMWVSDTSNELIFRPVSSATELGISSTGGAWISADEIHADYIPTSYTVNQLYDAKNDIRYRVFFEERDLLDDGTFTAAVPCFVKYPGNPDLIRTSPNLMNMGKPFRLSELYLIVAEASQLNGDEATANEYLCTMRRNRILRSPTSLSYTGDVLRDEIRLERHRELLGEGFRMSDLRRWGLGFTRTGDFPTNPAIEGIIVRAGANVTYQPGDHRFVWPIPASEIQVNPQMSGQQNPGYGN